MDRSKVTVTHTADMSTQCDEDHRDRIDMQVNSFVIENCFNVVYDDDGEPVYWLPTKDEDGYVLMWPDGESFHTYRHPENFLDVK